MDLKEEHRQAIKRRLNQLVGKMKINKLKTSLEAITDYDFRYETISNTLNFNSPALDALVISAIARYYDVDVAKILAPPDSPDDVYFEGKIEKSGFEVLRDLKYCCKTHGYLYSSKVNKDDIDSFEMEIKPIGDDIKAFLKLEYNTIRDGVSKMAYKQYVGTPYKINLQNVYIMFRDMTGDYLFMSFSYVEYSIQHIYFRRGALVTRSREAHRSPLVQAFVLFDAPISDEDKKYITGFLPMTTMDDRIHIPVHLLEDLAKEDDDVRILFDKCGFLFKAKELSYYSVTEQELLAVSHGIIPQNSAIRAVLRIKSIAEVPTRVSFPENNELSDFSRSLKKEWTRI